MLFVLRYTLFAVNATAVNIATQMASFAVYDGAFALALAMGLGTGTGLVVKYLLDKRWIFFDLETGARAHGRKFGLYTLMGVATTAIF
jgi:putative flippase GtrA